MRGTTLTRNMSNSRTKARNVQDEMWDPLVGILENASKMSAVDADFEIAVQQIKYAGKLYNGLSIEVDGYEFNIKKRPRFNHMVKSSKKQPLLKVSISTTYP